MKIYCIIAVRIFIIIILDVFLQQGKQSNEAKIITQEISLVEKHLRHKPSRKPSSLVHSLFPTTKFLTFFLISINVDLENKVIGFQFEPEKNISNHKGFCQDSSDKANRHV